MDTDKDDDFYSSMYSELTSDDINDPFIFSNKLEFWTEKIHDFCRASKSPSFTLSELTEELSYKNLRPSRMHIFHSALKFIIKHLINNRDVIRDYSCQPLDSRVAGLDFLFNKMYEFLSVTSDNIREEEQYYYVPYLEDIGVELCEQFRKEDDKSPFYEILTPQVFYNKCERWGYSFSHQDFHVVLGHLTRQNLAAIKRMEDETVLKLAPNHVTETDVAACRLKKYLLIKINIVTKKPRN
ncbi:hypothetical protein RF11_11594 [Thelohanellus kitauei]|uniref:Uncharacterized protein n=1 Tax=Thelohanellus kitauei TaxID=669202 RepID=A0A0C2N1J1_THEKT|nr:hypothetical protein RF11_11594 [Thelohanellus kitauei]